MTLLPDTPTLAETFDFDTGPDQSIGRASTVITLVGDFENYGSFGASVRFAPDSGGNSMINGGTIDGFVDMNKGNDIYRGEFTGSISGFVFGGRGNDKLFGAAKKDKFSGGDGKDILVGGGGNDVLQGGRGTDKINGGKGKDTMKGGSGDDIFIFKGSTGTDAIKDFENGADRLNLKAYDANSVKQLKNMGALQSDGDGGTIIDMDEIGGNGEIRIADMSLSQWNNADFIF